MKVILGKAKFTMLLYIYTIEILDYGNLEQFSNAKFMPLMAYLYHQLNQINESYPRKSKIYNAFAYLYYRDIRLW